MDNDVIFPKSEYFHEIKGGLGWGIEILRSCILLLLLVNLISFASLLSFKQFSWIYVSVILT